MRYEQIERIYMRAIKQKMFKYNNYNKIADANLLLEILIADDNIYRICMILSTKRTTISEYLIDTNCM